jgi:broad specificity phosphatase PhoE
MQNLRRIVLVRHGETVGESSIRFHGATDVALSELGRRQARGAATQISRDAFDLVFSSSLSRAWQTALILMPGRPVRLEPDFREIDFGRWEGLTREEIAARDPVLYEAWQAKRAGFEFPDGEARGDFRSRVLRGLDRVKDAGITSAMVVAHKGVVRTLAEALIGHDTLSATQPELGGVMRLLRGAGDRWQLRS